MYRYLPIKERLYMDEIGEYISFGIRVIQDTDSEKAEILYVSDVSLDFDFVNQLTELCNTLQLEPIHLLDVIEDRL